jgi:microcystin-dependent protein
LPLETATYLTDLVTSNPAHTDGLSQADSHMRLTKATIKATFPNFTSAALASTQAQLDAAVAATVGTGPLRFPLGTAALPSITPVGNPATGLWSPAADQLALSLSGAQVLLMGGTALVTSLGIAAAAFATTGSYSGGTGQLVPIGHTGIWWDDVLPAEGGYVWCNGVPISRTLYPILFARWGTRFGIGDGSTTFGIPDLRDTVPVGKSTMGAAASRALQTLGNTVLGTLIGLANNVLVLANLPPITSTNPTQPISVTSTDILNKNPTSGTSSGPGAVTPNGGTFGTTEVSTGNNSISVTSTGTTSTAVNNVQPSTTCNYILRAA